jgi:hypothetical protein
VGSLGISHFVRIERSRSTRCLVACCLVGEGVQDVLGLRKSMGPSLFGHELRLEPSGNPILIVRRKGRYLAEDICERPSHAPRIPPRGLPNKPLQMTRAAPILIDGQRAGAARLATSPVAAARPRQWYYRPSRTGLCF